jgi:hypothetical protein
MYDFAETWNPFKGCLFDCVYCKPSFQAQAKRQKHNCQKCYHYAPHYHADRLNDIPDTEIIFVCGNGDIAFCEPAFVFKIIERIRNRNEQHPHATYYLQSKRPSCLRPFLSHLPESVILVTTLETNRDAGYRAISKAPPPSKRYAQFKALDYPRRVVTVEPVMDFDLDPFVGWITEIHPEYVWLGFNTRPKSVKLPEPSPAKLQSFMERLVVAGVPIRGKDLRGPKVPASITTKGAIDE